MLPGVKGFSTIFESKKFSCHVKSFLTIFGRKLDGFRLGKKMSFVHGSYTQWVIDRAMTFGLPYTLPRLLSSTTRESGAWQVKYQTSERVNDTIMGILEQTTWKLQEKERENAELKDLLKRKDAIIDRMPGSRRRCMDFFAYAPSDFEE